MEINEYHPIDFKNAVDQMARPEVEKKPLLPVFEAIHNSIQSIQQADVENGEIIVSFVRKDDELDPKGIVEIQIEDNGLGFTKENILSFGRLFSTYKKNKFNCKGIGRLAFFVPFFNVNIESIYREGQHFFEINETVTEKNFYTIVQVKPREVKNTEVSTKLTLSGLNPSFASLYKIPSGTVKNEIVQHFLPSLLSIKNIKFKIVDGEEYYLDDSVQDVTRDAPIVLDRSTFEIYHLKNRSPHRAKHKVILSADGRSVKEETINFLPAGKIGEGTDKFYLNTVVISDYLNEKLNAQRTDFNIPQVKCHTNECIDLGTIYGKVFESSRAFSRESIKFLENVLDRLIEKTFDDLPHLSFLREDNDIRKNLRLGDDASAVKDAYVKKFAEKQVESFNYVRAISKKYEKTGIPCFDEFRVEALEKLDEGMKINHAPLVSYIKYRDFVLNLYEKLLEKKADGNYQPEKILHNILFPTKTESVDAKSDYFNHNLWIVDDRYAVYDFLVSDMPEGAFLGSPYDPKDKRYDICAAYSDPSGEEHNVFVVELKKTSLPLSENNDPISQLKNYVQRMINGKMTRYSGTRINITGSTQFFGLVLCDIHSGYFKEYMIGGHSLKKRPDGKSYHSVMLNDRLFVEVTNYENLLDIAHLRNKVFIEKLNHK